MDEELKKKRILSVTKIETSVLTRGRQKERDGRNDCHVHVIEPITEAPLLQTLGTCNQFLSFNRLREDMPKSWKAFWEGAGFCILGGMPGAFAGIWMLSHLPAEQLMKIFAILLILYSIYSMFKPAGAKIRGFDG